MTCSLTVMMMCWSRVMMKNGDVHEFTPQECQCAMRALDDVLNAK